MTYLLLYFLKSTLRYTSKHPSYDPATTPEYLPKKNENLFSHKNLYTNAYSVLFVITENYRQPPTGEWTIKPWCIIQ